MSSSASEAIPLRYTEHETPGEVSGWVVKEGKTLKQRKPRYLRLRGTELSNHKDQLSSATWTISVIDCSVGPGSRKNELLVKFPKRQVSFFTGTHVEFETWIIALKRASSRNVSIGTFYRMGGVIGEGINGDVLKGWDKVTNETVAIKSVPYEPGVSGGIDPTAEKEIEIIKSLNHDNLVRTYDVFRDQTQQKVYIVMEYVGGGELHARVANENGSLIKEGDAIRIARNILSAVMYLHKRGIAHRDIKLENVLCIDRDMQKPIQVKLADFGLSSKITGKDPCMSSTVGTGYYFAPEIIKKEAYGPSVDMWACGVLFYITLSTQLPFFGEDVDEYYDSVLSQKLEFPSPEWDNVSKEAKDFIAGLLEKDPEKRLTAAEALRHRWVTDKSIADVDLSTSNEVEEEEEDGPKSIFGKRKTPAEILAKVKQESSRV